MNEKLQWLKIYNRDPQYTKMVDKYESKNYITSVLGKRYIIPTIGIYNSFDEIDFDKLPNQFVMKCTHDSGGVIVCKDKNSLDIENSSKMLKKILKRNFYYFGREWPYKNVKHRIIVEDLLENKDGSDLIEYNFFCFNGIPKFFMTCYGDKRYNRYNDYYDMDFNRMNLKWEYKTSKEQEKKPELFDEMIDISKKLSKNIPHLRVDLYLCNGKIYVGELTFFHWSGFGKIEPDEWNYKLGDLIEL